MREALQFNLLWQAAGTAAAWFVTLCLLLAGLVGCVLPVLPGHLILLIGMIAHRLMLSEAVGLQRWSFVVLGLLMGTRTGMGFKVLVGVLMVAWFFIDVFLIGK